MAAGVRAKRVHFIETEGLECDVNEPISKRLREDAILETTDINITQTMDSSTSQNTKFLQNFSSTKSGRQVCVDQRVLAMFKQLHEGKDWSTAIKSWLAVVKMHELRAFLRGLALQQIVNDEIFERQKVAKLLADFAIRNKVDFPLDKVLDQFMCQVPIRIQPNINC